MLRWRPSTTAGFPHSDIHGSMLVCSSPWLFAAYHVFRRLLVPRHPPYALISLIIFRIGSFRYDSLTSAWCLVSTFWNCSRLHITALCFFSFSFFFSPRIYSLCSFQGSLVGSSGLEPPTSRLSGVRSNQLSYRPMIGIERWPLKTKQCKSLRHRADLKISC